ncbi:hypothetical protein [Actinomadura parmotrematis]|uniref:Thioredoxin domain-containing protein n=1 Tax=Actinomadura parmotrematis TaxID=2864039 RepID=A0ABS7FY75_9ACTN|nr:hypothetical protein [Actinomadura parmotrematis]MBW8485390.1 hypothetical protein [Actinomadura parmotrematis]
MRPGGDHEPDDYGLPRVDVVVPDDARELERDVHAYHRERRAHRRRARLLRLLGPLARFGLTVPLIAGAVVVALVSGALMTFLGPRPAPGRQTGLLGPAPSASPGRVGGELPDTRITLVEGRPVDVPLRDQRPAVFGIAAASCGCRDAVARLSATAQVYDIDFFLVADTRGRTVRARQVLKELTALASTSHDGSPRLATDGTGLLSAAYAPARPGPGLTIALVRTDGIVTAVRRNAAPSPELTTLIHDLG